MTRACPGIRARRRRSEPALLRGVGSKHREVRAGRVVEDRDTPDVRDVHRLLGDGPAALPRPRRGGVDVLDREVDHPVRWHLLVERARVHDAADSTLVASDVDGQVRRAALGFELPCLPPEELTVEVLFAVRIARVELVPDDGSGFADDPGAGKAAWLPDTEEGAGRIGEERHPAEV